MRFPVPSDDVLAAWRVAPDLLQAADLVLGGASAGGNLVAGVTARLRDAGEPVPSGLVLVYPALHPDGTRPGVEPDANSRTVQISLDYAGSPDRLRDPYVFPGLGTGAGFPSTPVVVCKRDRMRPSGEAFTHLLDGAGIDTALHVEPAAGHGHINESADPPAQRTIAAVAIWIRG